jgi:hypothetical protein
MINYLIKVTHLLIFISILLEGCSGFKPLYQKNNDYKIQNSPYSFVIESDNQEYASYMYNSIIDNIGIYNISNIEKYNIYIKISSKNVDSLIAKNTDVIRQIVQYEADYKISLKDTKKVIKTGSIKLNTSYNTAKSPFATYVNLQKESENIINTLSRKIITEISVIIK